jgi:hypothetical protein
VLASTALAAQSLNGFDLSNAAVPVGKILSGGPPRDGIPAIDQPRFVDADQDRLLQPKSLVVGVYLEGISRAYPIAILNWHELVNDRFGDSAVVVSYCPLCGSAMVFAAEQGGRTLQFGVSGLLYNSDLLLYDRQTESLWSQISAEAISGEMVGRRLKLLPSVLTSWQRWLAEHPGTQVLSSDTGYRRDYQRSPYADYEHNEQIYFPVEFLSRRYHPKERVLGLALNGQFKAYPFVELAKLPQPELEDRFAGQRLKIRFDLASRSGRVFADGGELPVVNSFWFAWYSFHPESEIFAVNPP